MTRDKIELSTKEVKMLYQFALNRIALIVLSANPASQTYKKATAVMKSDDQPAEVFKFIMWYNKLNKKS